MKKKIIDYVIKNKVIAIIIAVGFLIILLNLSPLVSIGLILYISYTVYKSPQKVKDKFEIIKQKIKEKL